MSVQYETQTSVTSGELNSFADSATKQQSCSFVAGSNHNLTFIKLALARGVTTTGTYTATIFAADGAHKPTGSALTSGTRDASTFSLSNGGNNSIETITMSSSINLTNGSEYCIVSRVANGATNVCTWQSNNGDILASSFSFVSTDGGSTWAALQDAGIDQDEYFEIWGDASGGSALYERALLGVGM